MNLANRPFMRRNWEPKLPLTGDGNAPRTPRSRKLLRLGAIVLALALASGAVVWHRFLFLGNVDVVDSGRVIRSAQPKGNLVPLLDRYRPLTILNLRGGTLNDPWYAAEVSETEKRGLTFYDLPLNASRRPSREELLRLVDILDRSLPPILIHCKSGSDRTGLATGLYYMTRLNLPPREAADRAFSIWRGHVPLFGPERLHAPFDEYEAWLLAQGLPHTSARFRRWLADNYSDGTPRTAFVPLKAGPRRR